MDASARHGLAVLEEVSKLNQQSTHPKVSVRVGIDSGAVVVGAGAGKDRGTHDSEGDAYRAKDQGGHAQPRE